MITVAPTGAENAKADLPTLPVTLDELISTASECQEAGASVIHVHVRDEQTQPTLNLHVLKETVAALREATSLVVQVSTGGAVSDPASHRLAALDCRPDTASLTCGTVNFGADVFLNPWSLMVDLYQKMQALEIVPEFEIFDIGHISSMRRLLDRHGPPFGGRIHCDLVMGVPGGMPATAAAVIAAVHELPEGATFSATGVGRSSLPVALAALASGGHLRVGMEDTVMFGPGEPVQDNRQLVTRAAELARLAQRPPMSTADARPFLGLPARTAGT
jgi:uncharacterized protein (DUF849 family)